MPLIEVQQHSRLLTGDPTPALSETGLSWRHSWAWALGLQLEPVPCEGCHLIIYLTFSLCLMSPFLMSLSGPFHITFSNCYFLLQLTYPQVLSLSCPRLLGTLAFSHLSEGWSALPFMHLIGPQALAEHPLCAGHWAMRLGHKDDANMVPAF